MEFSFLGHAFFGEIFLLLEIILFFFSQFQSLHSEVITILFFCLDYKHGRLHVFSFFHTTYVYSEILISSINNLMKYLLADIPNSYSLTKVDRAEFSKDQYHYGSFHAGFGFSFSGSRTEGVSFTKCL